MIYNNQINNSTIERQTLSWGSNIDYQTIKSQIKANTFKLKITGLTPERTYQWVVKPQIKLPNSSSISADNFTTAVGETEKDIDIVLADDYYEAGNTYYFGMRDTGSQEGIQIAFELSQNIVLATGTTVINNIVGGSWTYSGTAPDQTTNKFVDQASLELNNITIFGNTKIPTNLAVQTFVDNQISTASGNYLKIDQNLNDLENKATARTNLDVYSTTQVDTSLALKQDILDEGPFVNGDKDKLDGIENGATADQTDAEIKTAYENNANTNAYTDSEKSKVAGLESSKFLGQYVNLTALQTAHPSPAVGSYAFVDGGAGQDVSKYLWDDNDSKYVKQQGESDELTASQVKTLYEANPDTNVYTDAEKTKLSQTETTSQLNARDSANRNRANHTGSQAISTVSGLQTELDSKAGLTENNTFTGDNTFNQPVSGVDPTAGTHFTTRSWSDPSGVVEQVNIIKDRFLAESLTINNWKLAKLEQLYKDILVASEQNTLPEVLLVPDLSADLSSPTSTKLINVGTETGNIAIQNTTVAGIVVNNTFDTSAFVGDEFITTNMHNYTDNFTVFFKTRPASVPSILQDLWASTIVNNTFRMAVMNTSKLRYSIRGIIDVVDSSNNYITTDLNAFAIGQGGGQAFTQVINTSSSARTQIANTTIPASSADVSIFKSGAGSNYRGVTTAIIAFSSFLTDSQINNINNLF